MKNIFLILVFFNLISCGKSKEVLMYDEKKVPKENISLVQIPNDVEILKVDNKTFDTPFSNNSLSLHLETGNHIFLVRYYCLWKTTNGDYHLLKSAKIELSLNIEKDKSYQLMHRKLNDYESALAFEKNPEFHFKALAKDSKIVAINSPTIQNPEKSEPVKENIKEESNRTNSKTNYLDALKFMYQNSSEEDQKEFLKWIEKEKK